MITAVVANDVDTYPTLTYAWASSVGSVERKLFALDRYSGRILLIGSLDHEQTQSYKLNIVVSDSEHTAYTELSIMITDDNDNAPIFDRPYYTFIMTGLLRKLTRLKRIRIFNHFVVLTENGFGESSMQVIATDLDSGLNGQIKYGIVDDVSGFRIDQQTGVITANRLKFDQKLLQKVSAVLNLKFKQNIKNKSNHNLIFFPQGIIDLLISATDQGTPSLSTVVSVRANICNSMHSNTVKFAQNEFRYEHFFFDKNNEINEILTRFFNILEYRFERTSLWENRS